LTTGGSNFSDFPEKQLIKFQSVYLLNIKGSWEQNFQPHGCLRTWAVAWVKETSQVQ